MVGIKRRSIYCFFEAFGWAPPRYVHLPTVLNADKKKLSKRDGSAAVEDYLKKGYLRKH
jgi:nondiscriminating glutamyl-tRNA synthetase